jgi:hypothetical protein
MDRYILDGDKIKRILNEQDHPQDWLAEQGMFSVSWLQKGLSGAKAFKETDVKAIARTLKVERWIDLTIEKASKRTYASGTSSAERFDDLHDVAAIIRKELRRDGEPRCLYAAISDGSFLAPFLRDTDSRVPDAGKTLTKANINRVEIRMMTPRVIQALHERGLVEDHLPQALETNLKLLENLYRVGNGSAAGTQGKAPTPVKIVYDPKYWTGLPLMWGFMIGDMIAYGRWKPDSRGRYVAGNTTWLARREGPGQCDFEYWSRVLETGSYDSLVGEPTLPMSQAVEPKASSTPTGAADVAKSIQPNSPVIVTDAAKAKNKASKK